MKFLKKLVFTLMFITMVYVTSCVNGSKSSPAERGSYDSTMVDTLVASVKNIEDSVALPTMIVIADTIIIDTAKIKQDSILKLTSKNYKKDKEYMEFRNKQIRQIHNLKLLDNQNKIMDSLLIIK